MSSVERIGEKLARTIDRRKFLDRTARTIFGIVAAGAAELVLVPDAEARDYCAYHESVCACNPPNGTYCNGCYYANCPSNCSFYTGYYPTACWCTNTCQIGRLRYYYQCCDCNCSGKLCGCAGFVEV